MRYYVGVDGVACIHPTGPFPSRACAIRVIREWFRGCKIEDLCPYVIETNDDGRVPGCTCDNRDTCPACESRKTYVEVFNDDEENVNG